MLPPQPWRIITLVTAWVQRKAPVTFTSSTWRQASSVKSSKLAQAAMRGALALFTRKSILPNRSTVRSTMAWTWSDRVTSATSGRASTPRRLISWATLSTSFHPASCSSWGKVWGSRPVPLTVTWAPSRAKARAALRPMPRMRPAPVTTATLPSNLPITASANVLDRVRSNRLSTLQDYWAVQPPSTMSRWPVVAPAEGLAR